jgi:ABC-type Fe3+ transport system permease subunit
LAIPFGERHGSLQCLSVVGNILLLNVVTLVVVTESIFGRFLTVNVPQRIAHVGILVIGALIALPLYFVWLNKKKFQRILTEFESESAYQRGIRNTSVVLYLVASLVLLFAGALFHGKMINH